MSHPSTDPAPRQVTVQKSFLVGGFVLLVVLVLAAVFMSGSTHEPTAARWDKGWEAVPGNAAAPVPAAAKNSDQPATVPAPGSD
jgi:hypothetical protein